MIEWYITTPKNIKIIRNYVIDKITLPKFMTFAKKKASIARPKTSIDTSSPAKFIELDLLTQDINL